MKSFDEEKARYQREKAHRRNTNMDQVMMTYKVLCNALFLENLVAGKKETYEVS